MPSSRRDLRHLLPPLLLMVLIFAMSSVPAFGEAHFFADRIAGGLLPGWLTPVAPWLDRYLSHVVHVTEYGLLTLLWIRALVRIPTLSRHATLLAWSIAALYGATDEFHQMFVPGRSASLEDWLKDIAGAALAVLLWQYWPRR